MGFPSRREEKGQRSQENNIFNRIFNNIFPYDSIGTFNFLIYVKEEVKLFIVGGIEKSLILLINGLFINYSGGLIRNYGFLPNELIPTSWREIPLDLLTVRRIIRSCPSDDFVLKHRIGNYANIIQVRPEVVFGV